MIAAGVAVDACLKDIRATLQQNCALLRIIFSRDFAQHIIEIKLLQRIQDAIALCQER